MDDEVQAALLELDEHLDKTAAIIERCGGFVNEGRLDGNVLLLKMNELAARLMSGAPA